MVSVTSSTIVARSKAASMNIAAADVAPLTKD